jgi:transposase-like protein
MVQTFHTSGRRHYHIDLAEVRTAEGKLYLFFAIDRTSKFVLAELVEKADMQASPLFSKRLSQRSHIASTPSSPITVSSLPTCRKTAWGQLPASADIPLTGPPFCMASIIG